MIFIVLGLAVILAVIAYNMYQENQYRKQVREQFGHSDKDALLNSKTSHVRDGKESGGKGLFVKKANKAQEAALRNLQEQDEIFAAKAKLAKPSARSEEPPSKPMSSWRLKTTLPTSRYSIPSSD